MFKLWSIKGIFFFCFLVRFNNKSNNRHYTQIRKYRRESGAESYELPLSGFLRHPHSLLCVSIHRNPLFPFFLSRLPFPVLSSPHHWQSGGGGCWAAKLWLAAGHTGEDTTHQWQIPAARASEWGHVERRRIKGQLNLSSLHHTVAARLTPWCMTSTGLTGSAGKGAQWCSFHRSGRSSGGFLFISYF